MVSKLGVLRWEGAGSLFWVLAAFLLLVFLTGGSARPDVQSLAVLRPAAVFLFFFAALSLKAEHIKTNTVIFSCAAALSAIMLISYIPLPNAFVTLFSGIQRSPAFHDMVGLTREWRPLSGAPEMTGNALFSVFVPLTVLVVAVQLDREQRFLLLTVLIALALLSGILGVLQTVGGYNSPFHLYRLTNEGAAVGLFANRNHQALLLSILFPMLMVFAKAPNSNTKSTSWRLKLAIAVSVVLVPLLLITGSRSGIFIGVICLASLPLFFKSKDFGGVVRSTSISPGLRLLAVAGVVALLVTATVLAARAEAIERLFTGGNMEDSRLTIWETALQIGIDSFPIGSGAGTFAPMYLVYERDIHLTTSYVNQAHNDWLDVFLTLGLGGVSLACFIVVWVGRLSLLALCKRSGSSRDVAFARLGAVILLSAAVASFFDYPMRTPIFSSIGVIALLWLNGIRNAQPIA
jgi:lipoprotein signal peptidase